MDVNCCHICNKDLSGAREMFMRALSCDQARLGCKHPEVAIRLVNLAGVLDDLGETSFAINHTREALHIFESTLPADHPNVRWARDQLARFSNNRFMRRSS